MIKNYILSIQQINDQRFWKPILWSGILTLITFLVILIAGWSFAGWFFDHLLSYFDFIKEGSWLKTAFRFILSIFAFLIGFFFFGSIQSAYLGIFIDQVIDGIQAKHYPEIQLRPPPTLSKSVIIAIKLIVLSFVINILASPLFLLGWFCPPLGISIQVLVNGYLIGKEYMTTVEERLPINFSKVKKSYTLYGASGSALWMIPVVNLFAPILVCASIFHAMAKECISVPKV